eukprot:scaffold2618_cov240-Pinguiococcus_pyrenoidosus.AAC.2
MLDVLQRLRPPVREATVVAKILDAAEGTASLLQVRILKLLLVCESSARLGQRHVNACEHVLVVPQPPDEGSVLPLAPHGGKHVPSALGRHGHARDKHLVSSEGRERPCVDHDRAVAICVLLLVQRAVDALAEEIRRVVNCAVDPGHAAFPILAERQKVSPIASRLMPFAVMGSPVARSRWRGPDQLQRLLLRYPILGHKLDQRKDVEVDEAPDEGMQARAAHVAVHVQEALVRLAAAIADAEQLGIVPHGLRLNRQHVKVNLVLPS